MKIYSILVATCFLTSFSVSAWAGSTYSTPYTITTLAGSSGNTGAADNTGSAAYFNQPQGVAVDSNGNLYVTDTQNNTIRKVTPDGGVTTLAGSAGSVGPTDGTGAAARFGSPMGIAIDSNGNLYVADSTFANIRKITPGGVVSTFAGGLAYGSQDGTGTAASFFGPSGVAVDSHNNVYVADSSNNNIRKITPDGGVTTLAGHVGTSGSTDGTGTAASFSSPYGLAVDSNGNIYVADEFNYAIRKVTPAGVVTTFAGSASSSGSNDGSGAAAQFFNPTGVAVDGSGNLYVSDQGNSTIRKITTGGVVTTLAGTAGTSGNTDGTGAAALFGNPKGLAVDANGKIYVADTGFSTIRVGTPPASQLDVFSGVALGGGWYYSAWFGIYNTNFYPWTNHNVLGFMYVSTSDNTNLYLYVLNGSPGSMGWIYTTRSLFPNVYSFSRGSWLYNSVGTTSFYNFNTSSWETY